MKLYRTVKALNGQAQGVEFVAARNIREMLEYIEGEDFPVAGWNPNMIEEVGELHVAPAKHIEAKVLKFENNDKS